jgi:rhamnopyranosyl-N-acetylglucosaminyl-diphospho-decaprenol beta-1,3/1,4-galactofuranosyltransferase
MRIAAVVVTRNRPQLLQHALAALRMQTRTLDALYVVDNASTDDSAACLGHAAGATVLRSDTNLGGAGGFTLGMAEAFAAGHDWIWLLDDDALPRPDALVCLVAALAGPAAHAGAVCGTVREFGDIAPRHRRRFHTWSGIERPLPRSVYAGPPCRTASASFVGLLVSAPAVAAVGLPEAAFFLAYDDTEYSLRLGRAGQALWLVPASVVEHLRERGARLRAGPFGPRHYFTIRNRIAVARRYGRVPALAGATGVLFGIGLWLASRGALRRAAVRILLRAVADGWQARLGPFPDALAHGGLRRSARSATAPGTPP